MGNETWRHLSTKAINFMFNESKNSRKKFFFLSHRNWFSTAIRPMKCWIIWQQKLRLIHRVELRWKIRMMTHVGRPLKRFILVAFQAVLIFAARWDGWTWAGWWDGRVRSVEERLKLVYRRISCNFIAQLNTPWHLIVRWTSIEFTWNYIFFIIIIIH